MLTRKDWTIILGCLALALVIFGATALSRAGKTPAGYIDIYVDGELYASAPIGERKLIEIKQGDEIHNTVEITENGARMHSSSCKNQLCVEQGEVTTENYTLRALGDSVICLPNRVVITLRLTDQPPHPDAPDV